MHDSQQYHSSGSLHAAWPWATHPVVQVNNLLLFSFTLLYVVAGDLFQRIDVDNKELLRCPAVHLPFYYYYFNNFVIRICNSINLQLWPHDILPSSVVPAVESHLLMNLFVDWRDECHFQNFILGYGCWTWRRQYLYFAPPCSQVKMTEFKYKMYDQVLAGAPVMASACPKPSHPPPSSTRPILRSSALFLCRSIFVRDWKCESLACFRTLECFHMRGTFWGEQTREPRIITSWHLSRRI